MTVCSSAFEAMGRIMAVRLGAAGLPIVVVPHPFGTRTREEIRALADRCAQDIADRVAGERR